jgi:hypothetical protein
MVQVVRYVNPGSTGGNGTTPALTGVNAAYASMSAWDAAEQTNLVTDGDTHLLLCAGGSDNTTCQLNGWTTDATHDITIQGDSGQSDGFNTTGAFSTSFYHMHLDATQNIILDIREDYVTVDGIQFLMDASDNINEMLSTFGLSIVNNLIAVKNCRFKNIQARNSLLGIDVNDGDMNMTIETCTFQWDNTFLDHAINCASFASLTIDNVTISGATTGINIASGVVTTVKNSCIFNCDDDISDPDATSTIDYCATDDGDGTNAQDMSPGGSEPDGWALQVTDFANGDFTPVEGSVLLDNGDATGAPATDIRGNDWGADHDIGAFTFTAPLPAASLFNQDHGPDYGESVAQDLGSFTDVAPVTLNFDVDNVPPGTQALLVGTAGTLNVTLLDGQHKDGIIVEAGIVPLAVRRVRTGGTATNIWALK